MKKALIILSLTLLLISSTITLGAESARYDFDEVDVIYAAEFTAYPHNVNSNWLSQLAGGSDKNVTVLYGVVDLKKEGKVIISEEFIKVTGEKGSERFLVNSASYSPNYTKSFFWSAKRIDGSSVVKDFSGPIRSITLYQTTNMDKQPESIIFTVSDDGNKASEEFWVDTLPDSYYQADLNTLHEAKE